MKNRFYYRSEMHPWGKIGGIFLLIVIPFTLLVLTQSDRFSLGETAEEISNVTVKLSEVSAAGDKEAIRNPELSGAFVPLAADYRKRLLQNIADYRAKYKQLQPRIAVVDETEGQATRKFSLQISSVLAMHQIQDSGLPEPKSAEDLTAPLILLHRPREAAIARDFLSTLAPAASGEVLLMKDDRLQSGAMLLVINNRPGFLSTGVAYF